jgi:hypothetical protein
MDNTEQLCVELIAETGIKSRGGLKNYNEMKKENVQRVRGDFLAPIFKPKITLAVDSVTFNMSCVNLLPDNQYVVINIDDNNQRIIIEPCMAYDRDSLKFAFVKNDRNNPRKCVAKFFCSMVYEMMGWNRVAKYRSLAIYQEFNDKKIIVFNLDECLQLFSEIVDSEDGKKKRNTIINMPEDWKGRFGYTLEELDAKNRVDTTSTLVTVDNKTGERHQSQIKVKLPLPEELMHRPYGGIRLREEEKEENE